MTEDELQQLKDELKKDSVRKIKERKRRSPKDLIPYMIVFFSFIISLVILYFILDLVIMPSFVGNRDTVEMPAIVGLNFNEAKIELLKKDLHITVPAEEFNSDVAPDVVLRQIPKPGARVKSGRTVFLTISKGQDSVKVPYLIGHDLRRASVLLIRRGLELGDTLYEFSLEYPKNNIIEQSIKAGSFVTYGSKIDIIISNGPEDYIEVPQLIGVELDELRTHLNELGLELGSVSYIEDETYLPFTVGAQNPKAGARVPAGTFINVSVYIEPNRF